MKEPAFLPDTRYEGREEYAVDVDRFINEGMAGGTVHRPYGKPNIRESEELLPEVPPR